MVQGLGFRVQGLGFRVQGLGFRIKGSGLFTAAMRFPVALHDVQTSLFGA